jgi:hypothetical protein
MDGCGQGMGKLLFSSRITPHSQFMWCVGVEYPTPGPKDVLPHLFLDHMRLALIWC